MTKTASQKKHSANPVLELFFGIGILGMFTATVAGVFVEKKLKEDKGMTSFNLKDHIIICEWNFSIKV